MLTNTTRHQDSAISDQPEMKITGVAPWFGAKRSMARLIASELGPHVQYFEPFCGSMAVLFGKEPTRHETVNDLHGDLINLAQVLQEAESAERLYDRLNRTLVCEVLLEQAGITIENVPLEDVGSGMSARTDRAYWFFLACWLCRNGTAGTQRQDYQIAVRWTKNGGSPAVRFRSVIDSIPAWHQRLQNVVILCRDAFDILPRFEDAEGTAIYVDPPYPRETRGNHDLNGCGRYLHEFSQPDPQLFSRSPDGGKRAMQEHDDWTRLATILRKFTKARIVVSSYECEKVRALFDGWTFVQHQTNKQLHQQNGRGNRRQAVTELLICNGPSLTAAP